MVIWDLGFSALLPGNGQVFSGILKPFFDRPSFHIQLISVNSPTQLASKSGEILTSLFFSALQSHIFCFVPLTKSCPLVNSNISQTLTSFPYGHVGVCQNYCCSCVSVLVHLPGFMESITFKPAPAPCLSELTGILSNNCFVPHFHFNFPTNLNFSPKRGMDNN